MNALWLLTGLFLGIVLALIGVWIWFLVVFRNHW